MKRRLSALLLPALLLGMAPDIAHAYIGPGAGISAIGSILALVAAVALALVGFLWYPIKRMRKGKRKARLAEQGRSAAS